MEDLPVDMKLVYLQRREQDLLVLKNEITNNSVAAFHRIGHQILGNALNFGFQELENLGRKMESLKKSEINSLGTEIVAEFENWLLKIRSQFPSR